MDGRFYDGWSCWTFIRNAELKYVITKNYNSFVLVALVLTIVIGAFSPILAGAFIVSYVIGFGIGFILDKD